MPQSRETIVTRLRQFSFVLIAGAVFGALLVYGLHPWAPTLERTADNAATAAAVPSGAPGATLAIREDYAIPKCDSPKAIEGITGQLVRTQKVRVSGLSNIAEVATDGHGGRTCKATVDLDFGPKPITYVIHRVGPGTKTWEMDLTGP